MQRIPHFCPRVDRNVKFTADLHLALMLRMRGDTHLLPVRKSLWGERERFYFSGTNINVIYYSGTAV
jgi:hypothetical protein